MSLALTFLAPDEAEIVLTRIRLVSPRSCDELNYGTAIARVEKLCKPFGDEYAFIFSFNGMTWDGVVIRREQSHRIIERDLMTVLAFIVITIEKNATRPY